MRSLNLTGRPNAKSARFLFLNVLNCENMTYALSSAGWATLLAGRGRHANETAPIPASHAKEDAKEHNEIASEDKEAASEATRDGAGTAAGHTAAVQHWLPLDLPGECPRPATAAAAAGEQVSSIWTTSSGQSPSAWFMEALGPRLQALLQGLRAELQRRHRHALNRAARAHAKLLAVRGAYCGWGWGRGVLSTCASHHS